MADMMDECLPELSSIEENYLNKVQSKIYYCHNCQAYDGGEVIWVQGDRTDVWELLGACRVPKKYWSRIVDYLYCLNCGTSNFELFSKIGQQTKFEKSHSKAEKKAKALFGKEVIELERFLQAHPLLALQNKFAKRIYNEIREKRLPTVEVAGEFFRARRVTNSRILSRKEMLDAPPIGIPLEGRFNHSGQSHLYLSDEKITALKEVASDEQLIWCQKVIINKPVMNILDLTFDWTDLTQATSALLLSLSINNTLTRSDRNMKNWKPDYCITRFIMDCAKSSGYLGIKYESAKEVMAHNVVLFYPEKTKINKQEEPTIEKLSINVERRGGRSILHFNINQL